MELEKEEKEAEEKRVAAQREKQRKLEVLMQAERDLREKEAKRK